MKLQSTPQRAATTLIVETPTRHYVFPWPWMHRAALDCQTNELGIVFPARTIIVTSRTGPSLLKALAAGEVTRITEVEPGKPESHSDSTWNVSKIEVIDPDSDDAE